MDQAKRKPIELVSSYVNSWREKGYPDDIPDEVPREIDHLAPSYRSIAIAILNNDLNFYSLGFERKKSEYYNILKRIELKERHKMSESSDQTVSKENSIAKLKKENLKMKKKIEFLIAKVVKIQSEILNSELKAFE